MMDKKKMDKEKHMMPDEKMKKMMAIKKANEMMKKHGEMKK